MNLLTRKIETLPSAPVNIKILPDVVTMREIEYHDNGKIKRIVFRDLAEIPPEYWDRLPEMITSLDTP